MLFSQRNKLLFFRFSIAFHRGFVNEEKPLKMHWKARKEKGFRGAETLQALWIKGWKNHLLFERKNHPDRIVIGTGEIVIQGFDRFGPDIRGDDETVNQIKLELLFFRAGIGAVQGTAGGETVVHQQGEVAAEGSCVDHAGLPHSVIHGVSALIDIGEKDYKVTKSTIYDGCGYALVDHNYKNKDDLQYVYRGNPVAGATVVIKDAQFPDTEPLFTTSTDAQGRWNSGYMAHIGSYTVTFYKEGFYGPDTTAIEVTKDDLTIEELEKYNEDNTIKNTNYTKKFF